MSQTKPKFRPLRWLSFLALACTLLPSCSPQGATGSPPEPSVAPHVLIVSFDALRADALGVYGKTPSLTPNLDAFAESAVVFESAQSAAPVTPTSFAAMLDGRLPWEVFLDWQFVGQNQLARSFKEAGYTTAAFFNNSQLTDQRGFGLGWDHYRWFSSVRDETVLAIFESWRKNVQPNDQPIFAWLHFLNPHSPYDRSIADEHLYDPSYRGAFETTSGATFQSNDAADQKQIRALYDGEVATIDRLFGAVQRQLQSHGPRPTVVAVLSDHGEEFLEHGNYQHQRLYRETVHVPLMVRTFPAIGARIKQPVSTQDLTEILGAALRGELHTWTATDRPLVAIAMTDSNYRGISSRRGESKLILNCFPDASLELYDLALDPTESNDLLASPAAATQRPEVRAHLDAFDVVSTTATCDRIEAALSGTSPTQGLAPTTVEALRSLGYVQ